MKNTIVLIASLLALLSAQPGNAAPPADAEGDYRMSRRVAVHEPEGKRWAKAVLEDCLHIGTPWADARRPVRLYSVQTNAHSCQIDGVASEVGKDLLVEQATSEGASCQLRLRFGAKAIHVASATPACAQFCGASASLQGVEYLRTQRGPALKACGG
jgi:hypothetical protein